MKILEGNILRRVMVWVLWLDSLIEMPYRHFKDITFGFTPDLSKQCRTCVPSFFTKSRPMAKFVLPPANYLTINVSHLCLPSQLILELLPEWHFKLLQLKPHYYCSSIITSGYYSYTFLYYKARHSASWVVSNATLLKFEIISDNIRENKIGTTSAAYEMHCVIVREQHTS